MDPKELQKTHEFYNKFAARWRFFISAYEGLDSMVENGVLQPHPYESDFERRKAEAVGFNYSKSIVNLFNFYLFESPSQDDYGLLQEDLKWTGFRDDCDLWGNNYDTFLVDQHRYASIYGHVGILVDMPQAPTGEGTPYLAAYHPAAILDWAYDRDPITRKPFLSFLKLLEEDGTYLIWTTQAWEHWREDEKGVPTMIGSGEHGLGVIPFVWLINLKSRFRNVGFSDIADIARIDASIIRDLSLGGEVINLGAFPMFRAPQSYKADVNNPGESVDLVVGPSAVHSFDPSLGDAAKPDWLEAKVGDPISAILSWVERKTQEIYRMSNSGGLQQSTQSKQVKSGDAIRQEFQLLNSVLASKATNLEEAERQIVYLWLLWQGREAEYKSIKIERPKRFSVEDLSQDLKNLLVSKQLVTDSPTFQRELQLSTAKRILPGLEDDDLALIEKEIEEGQAKTAKAEETMKGYNDTLNLPTPPATNKAQ